MYLKKIILIFFFIYEINDKRKNILYFYNFFRHIRQLNNIFINQLK